MKNAEAQVEDQRQRLHLTEIGLAIERQMVKDLKAELQRAKEAAQVAKEAAKAVEETAYKHGVAKTETRLAEEVAVVCRDY